MIYVSSSCVKNTFINESVLELANAGFKNIELSGGTQPYEGMLRDLLQLQDQFELHYLCHNYFPPPELPFVINLSSLDTEIVELSIKNIKKAIDLTVKLGANSFGFHAGFRINIPLQQIGESISNSQLFDYQKSLAVFIESLHILNDYNHDVKLYVENNVLAQMNYDNFNKNNPFFLCETESFEEINKLNPINLLLDVAHLKVSCNTLNKNFEVELDTLIKQSDYIHISDNDGKKDANNIFSNSSKLYNQLKNYTFENKSVTLEVYDGIDALKESYETALKLYE